MSEVIEAIHDPSYKELQSFVEILELQFLYTCELTTFEVGTAVNGKGFAHNMTIGHLKKVFRKKHLLNKISRFNNRQLIHCKNLIVMSNSTSTTF